MSWFRFCHCVFVFLLLIPLPAHAQWHDESRHMSMDPPSNWTPMSEGLLARVNSSQGVLHVTGGDFVAGFTRHLEDELLFPYLLIQRISWDDLPTYVKLSNQPTDHAMLALIGRLVVAFEVRGPLPSSLDAASFSEAYDCDMARLVRVSTDGRFAIAGTIPTKAGGSINYFTQGLVGVEGIATATLFNSRWTNDLEPLISQNLRSLAFDEGFDLAAIKPIPAAPVPVNPGPAGSPAPQPEAIKVIPPPTGAAGGPANTQHAQTPAATEGTGGVGARVNEDLSKQIMPWILGVAAVLVVGIGTAVVITLYLQAKQREQKARARRERRHTHTHAQTPPAPRQAPPQVGQSHHTQSQYPNQSKR